jgi:hypothetical protein
MACAAIQSALTRTQVVETSGTSEKVMAQADGCASRLAPDLCYLPRSVIVEHLLVRTSHSLADALSSRRKLLRSLLDSTASCFSVTRSFVAGVPLIFRHIKIATFSRVPIKTIEI